MAVQGDRRRLLLGGGVLIAGLPAASVASTLPVARNLSQEVGLAAQRGQPLIVLVSLEGCVHCERVRRSNLLPRLALGQAMVQVNLRSNEVLQDGQGRSTTHDALARQWKVRVTPTLLFLGPGARELAERMEGAYQPDFYEAYLEDRLGSARQQL
jgi:thioredoxin-related protein